MVHAAKKKKNGLRSGGNFPVMKITGKKTCFGWTAFMRDYISAYLSRMAFMELDFVPNEPRMKAKLRVMMTEL